MTAEAVATLLLGRMLDELDAVRDRLSAADRIWLANRLVDAAAEVTGLPHPVGRVQWVPIDRVVANDWNPNQVADHEMRLLHTSVAEDGLTQPVVTVWDPDREVWQIVDGFHRWTVTRRYPDVLASTGGYLPVVVIDKPPADRMAATIRHNRARGKHSVAGMSALVFKMLLEGEDDATICHKIGLEADELARLKHVTGYSKLYAEHEYSPVVLTATQVAEKARYAREHPEETVPPW